MLKSTDPGVLSGNIIHEAGVWSQPVQKIPEARGIIKCNSMFKLFIWSQSHPTTLPVCHASQHMYCDCVCALVDTVQENKLEHIQPRDIVWWWQSWMKSSQLNFVRFHKSLKCFQSKQVASICPLVIPVTPPHLWASCVVLHPPCSSWQAKTLRWKGYHDG